MKQPKFKIPSPSNATWRDHLHFRRINKKAARLSVDQMACDHPLSQIANRYRDSTDKCPTTAYWRKHCYTEFYGPLFAHLRNRPVSVLKIGVRWGGSILMWDDFFKTGTVCAVDQNLGQMKPEIAQEVHRRGITLFEGNAYAQDFVEEHLAGRKFDIILDDGSHYEDDQVKFFSIYKHLLKDDGYLLCEDFPTQNQARRVIDRFDGPINNISLIIRNHCVPSGKGEIVVMYKS